MAIAGIVNVALNGYEAKVTTKEEAKQMILSEVGKMVEQFAGDMPVEPSRQMLCKVRYRV